MVLFLVLDLLVAKNHRVRDLVGYSKAEPSDREHPVPGELSRQPVDGKEIF